MTLMRSKYYRLTKFSPETIREAFVVFGDLSKSELRRVSCEVDVEDDGWGFDNDSDFFNFYKDSKTWFANYSFVGKNDHRMQVRFKNDQTYVGITLDSRSDVDRVLSVFDSHVSSSTIPEWRRDQSLRRWLKIFIGHGRSQAWRDVKDHLGDLHGFNVIAYETGARAGQHIVEILDDAKKNSGFAVLVMTAENRDIDDVMHARENVIHEIGLFQGKLGTKKAIVLLEEGCIPFSNLAGVQYIPFSKDKIKETFGDILATIRREFNSQESGQIGEI